MIERLLAVLRRPGWQLLARQNVLAGLMFMGVAALGLYLSRDYPIGSVIRMGTGYVPRLLCWVLLALGLAILVQGLAAAETEKLSAEDAASAWRPLVFVTGSLVVFGLTLETLGIVVSVALLTAIGAFAARGLRPLETAIAGLVLIGLSYGIFILGLGIVIPVWPVF